MKKEKLNDFIDGILLEKPYMYCIEMRVATETYKKIKELIKHGVPINNIFEDFIEDLYEKNNDN